MITYRDDFRLWPHIETQLMPRLPLRNLSWKSVRGIRTIPSLDVSIQKFEPSLLPKSAILASLTPAIHLYFVHCDDLDTYKQVIRTEIKDWVSNFTGQNAKRTADQDWAILYINTNAHPGPSGSTKFASQTQKFLSLKSTVLDKIKSDFGATPPIATPVLNNVTSVDDARRLDRVISLRINAGDFTKDNDAWSDFFMRIKHGILASFEAQVGRYDDDIARLDAQRMIPGWNFCQFFLLKEGLANCFAATSLIDDALVQLDELEATFEQTVHRQVVGFTEFVSQNEPAEFGLDDAGPMLLLNRPLSKDYRSLLLNNSISVFDFRIYLASRQFAQVIKARRPLELSKRVTGWLRGFLPQVHAHCSSLPPQFSESLTISVVEAALDAIDTMIPLLKSDAGDMVSIQNAKLDLILYGKAALDRIGVIYHEMTASLARFTIHDAPLPEPTEKLLDFKLTTPTLITALKSLDDFAKVYTKYLDAGDITARLAQRPRFSMLVQTDRANLEYTLGHWAQAGDLYSKVIAGYADGGWLRIDQCLLHRQAQCYRQVGARNEYLMTCLRLIASNIVNDSTASPPFAAKEPDPTVLSLRSSGSHILGAYSLIDWVQLIDVARELDEAVVVDFTPLFEVRLPAHLFTLRSETHHPSITALSIDPQSPVIVISRLASILTVDRISLVLVGGESGDLVFSTSSSVSVGVTASDIQLIPGDDGNVVDMTWDLPGPAGEYVVEKVMIEVGKLIFVANLIKENRKHTLRIVEPPSPLLLSLCLPPLIDATNRSFVVRFHSIHPVLANGVLALWSLLPSATALASESAALIDPVAGTIVRPLDRAPGENSGRYLLPDLDTCAMVLVTLVEPWDRLEIKALLECRVSLPNTSQSTSVQLAVSKLDSVVNAHVPSVHVELQVIGGAHQYLTLTVDNTNDRHILYIDECAVHLSESASVILPVVNEYVIVPPARSALIAFSVPEMSDDTYLKGKICFKHHFFDEDVRAHLYKTLDSLLVSKDLSLYYPILHRMWSSHVSSLSWTQLILTGTMDMPNPGPLSPGILPAAIQSKLVEAADQFYVSMKTIKLSDIARDISQKVHPTRQLHVPLELELPIAHLQYGLSLGPKTSVPMVGTSWPCQVVVTRTATTRFNNEVLYLVYEVLASDDEWLVVGSRRKGFQLGPENHAEFSISLIPLLSGDIPLPEIRLTVQDSPGTNKCPAVSLELLSGTEFPQSVLVKPESSTTLVIANGTNVQRSGNAPVPIPVTVVTADPVHEFRGRPSDKLGINSEYRRSDYQLHPSPKANFLRRVISGSQSLIGLRRSSEFSIASSTGTPA